MDNLAVSNSDFDSRVSAFPAIVSLPAELFLWDGEESNFVGQGDVEAKVVQSNTSRYEYWFVAVGAGGEQLFAHPVTAELNARWSERVWCVTWNHETKQGRLDSWCFKFEGEEGFKAFSEAHSKALYEHLNESSWEKAKVSRTLSNLKPCAEGLLASQTNKST